MLRIYHVLLAFILIPIGITTAVFYFPKDKKSEPNSIKTPLPATTLVNSNNAKSQQSNIWNDILKETPLPTGWKINPCENNNSLLCVSANGKPLGSVKMEILPLKAQIDFQNMLIEAEIPPNSNIDYRSPKYLSKVTIALNAWVTNRYKILAQNNKYIDEEKLKTAKTADGILFSAYPPQKARVGKLEGIRYGFAGLKQKGGLEEQHTSYVAFDGKALYLINTAFNSSSSTGNFEKLENLSVFQPYLNTVVANLKLPK